jgi:predicted signal transduction protein with EAL and GGDEF domain
MREEDETIDDLLARADQAQYSAKTSGKAQIRSQLDINQLPLFEEEASSSDQQD